MLKKTVLAFCWMLSSIAILSFTIQYKKQMNITDAVKNYSQQFNSSNNLSENNNKKDGERSISTLRERFIERRKFFTN